MPRLWKKSISTRSLPAMISLLFVINYLQDLNKRALFGIHLMKNDLIPFEQYKIRRLYDEVTVSRLQNVTN